MEHSDLWKGAFRALKSPKRGSKVAGRLRKLGSNAYLWKPWLHGVRAIIYDSTYCRCFSRGDHTVGWYAHRGEQV